MSKPCEISKEDPVGSVAGEIIDAMSSLNMEPDPITPNKAKDVYYLSDVDGWAKHANEHLRQAMAGTRVAREYIQGLEREIYQLKRKLMDLKSGQAMTNLNHPGRTPEEMEIIKKAAEILCR